MSEKERPTSGFCVAHKLHRLGSHVPRFFIIFRGTNARTCTMSFIIGRKKEMTQVFREDGQVVPVTLIHAEPNVVAQIRTKERDGYVAVQLGTRMKGHLNKPEAGHVKDLSAARVLREFRVESTDLTRGQMVDVSSFAPGMHVDVVGTSKGRGFTGVMKRHGFSGGPATHGQKDQKRMPGSIGSQRQGPVIKGKRMGGHMGAERVTVKNLEVVSVDPESNIIALKGAIPGARNSIVLIEAREGKRVWQR